MSPERYRYAAPDRLIVRNGRLVQRITSQTVGLADLDSDGTVLVRNEEPNGLSSNLDGLPLGRDGVSQVDVDRDGVVDAGWELRASDMGLLPRLGAFEAEGQALVAVELTGPVPGLYRAIARATLAQPKIVVCSGEPSSLGRPVNLRIVGSDLVALNDLTVTIADLPPQSVAITIFSRDTGFVPMAAGGLGTLCLGGSIGRGSIVSSGLGLESNINVPLLTDGIPQPNGPVAGLVGETWNTQAWYRDQLPTGGATNNFSDAISFTFR